MKQFLQRHTPYRNRYLCQYERRDLFSEVPEKAWMTKHEYLLDQTIDAALKGAITIACLSGASTKVLGIDIDDHRGLGKEYLLNLYDQTVQKVGCNPSLLCKSPRGLHAYWYLGQYLPTELLVDSAKKELGKLPVEVRPSMTEALRVPKTGAVLDPETLHKVYKPIEQYMAAAPTYHYAELFQSQLHHEYLRKHATVTQKRDKAISLSKAELLSEAEARIAPGGFINGQTNDQFLELEWIYRTAGLEYRRSFRPIKLILDRSYGYSKNKADAISLKNIRKRLECTYKKNNNQYIPQPKDREQDLFDEPLVNDLIAKSIFAKQREKKLRYFLGELLAWCTFHDNVMKDPKQAAIFDWYYKYYRKNRKEGYYPLPTSKLKAWNSQYNSIIKWLLSIGFLEESPYHYSTLLNTCKYYKVHRNIPMESIPSTGLL